MNLTHIKKTHTLQLDQSDCGVACLLSLIKLYNGNSSFEKLREISGTNREGTTILGLYHAANKIGFNTQGCQADIQALIDHSQPVILHVLTEDKLQHYVVCYEYNQNKGFLIGDPSKGISTLSIEELEKIWVSKACLTLEPNEKFVLEKTEKKKQREWFLSIIKEDYKLIWISTLLGVFVAGLGMAMALFSQKLIDDILPAHDVKKLISGIVLLFVLLVSRVVISVLRQYFLLQQSKDFNNRINSTFFSSLLQLPKPFFDTRKIGELVARLNDTQRIQSVIKMLSSTFVIDILISGISLIFLFAYSWRLGLISLLSIPVYFFIIFRNNEKIINSQKEVMQSYAINESNYINAIQAISTIKNDNKQAVFTKLNENVFAIFQQKTFELGKTNISLTWQSGLASVIFLMGILSYTSFQVFNKGIKIGELMAILGIISSLLPSIANLALIAIPINEAKIAFSRMYEFASIEKEKEQGLKIFDIEKIDIQNIAFRFAGRSELFRDLNLEIKKGKFTALVGESGSGKSTLGQILQRFYQTESGDIILNNKFKIQEIELKCYRDLVGVIPQEIAIINGNIIDNILLGTPASFQDILDFIKEYSFDTFFNQFPQGLTTIIGEEGINLSGGQKQIIALARVLYKKPQFLILDEATAAMDKKTEAFMINIFQRIKKNCAILFISHNLNRLKDTADVIYVLENKTISNFGNHLELMKTNNFYSDYWSER